MWLSILVWALLLTNKGQVWYLHFQTYKIIFRCDFLNALIIVIANVIVLSSLGKSSICFDQM